MHQHLNDWRPTATLHNLRLRAELLTKIRQFFAARNVLEVETPLLSNSSNSDPHLASFKTIYNINSQHPKTLFLQTSPEFAMKRLLAAGSGPIYQICKAFRDGESGQQHNPEFTMLEWYRPSFDHHKLMDEMDEFLAFVINTKPANRMSYRDAFLHYLDIDPFKHSISGLQTCATQYGIQRVVGMENADKDTWLNLLISHLIEPHLGTNTPTYLYDFPPSQAALAKIRQDNPPVAERFEVYINGMELANGFHELTDPEEQRKRFEEDNKKRQQRGLPTNPLDENLLAALALGLPDCAGVALGIDRLLMALAQTENIADVITFPVERA